MRWDRAKARRPFPAIRPLTWYFLVAGQNLSRGPGVLWSGVEWSADAEPGVEAQRLHDLEGGGVGELLDVGGGQHAGVFGDDGRGRAFGDGVQVGFDPGPGVLPGRYVEGDRVDRGQRLPRARLDVGDVLLVHRDVVAGGEPAEGPATALTPRRAWPGASAPRLPRRALRELISSDGTSAGVDDIDEHQ